MFIKIPKRFDHRARLLRGRSTVEINQRMPMRLLVKNREIFTDRLPIDRGRSNFVHITICYTRRDALLVFEDVNTVAKYSSALDQIVQGAASIEEAGRVSKGGTRCPQRVGKFGFAAGFCASGDCVMASSSAKPIHLCKRDGYFSSSFTSAKALTANSRSSRECAADTCVRTRAVPCGTTG